MPKLEYTHINVFFWIKVKHTSATKTKICLFVIPTSIKKLEFIEEQFETYDPLYFGMIVNIYDADGKNETNASRSITRLFFGGFKPKLYLSIGEKEVEHYEYVWFMDDDLLFQNMFFHLTNSFTLLKVLIR